MVGEVGGAVGPAVGDERDEVAAGPVLECLVDDVGVGAGGCEPEHGWCCAGRWRLVLMALVASVSSSRCSVVSSRGSVTCGRGANLVSSGSLRVFAHSASR